MKDLKSTILCMLLFSFPNWAVAQGLVLGGNIEEQILQDRARNQDQVSNTMGRIGTALGEAMRNGGPAENSAASDIGIATPQQQTSGSNTGTNVTTGCGQLGCGGVQSIRDNGRINGDPSWTITCGSGWGVVRRSRNAWADNSGNTYSDRLWSLSLEEFARRMCE